MSTITKPKTINDEENPCKRMEYEAVLQLRDQAHLMFEMLMAQGYCSGPLYDLKKKLDELSREVSIGL